jgi:8-oxo-dGTP pyrophosphatase MutT (NUDIX family)
MRRQWHARLDPASSSLVMPFFHRPKRLSCGVVILNRERELLLCHVTGHDHWDLPKGGIDGDETPLQAALRETREETGLALRPDALLDLGRFDYTLKKRLHLYATCMPRFDTRELHCDSHYLDRRSGSRQPEMDGYGWFGFARVSALCTPKMAQVLGERIDLQGVLARVAAPVAAPRVAIA